MSKKQICFIVNPASGIGRKNYLRTYIDKYLDHEQYTYAIRYTKAPRHATELTRKAVAEGASIVVAVGGDGSVNEVAEGLLNTSVALGILPMGSGNAFASHWGISRRLKQAIEVLNRGNIVHSDIAFVNNRLLLATSGVGFAAYVAYLIKGSQVRGFLGYLKIALSTAFTYKSQTYRLRLENNIDWITRECFILEVSNVKYYGYGVQIAPPATATDGLLNLTLVLERPRFDYLKTIGRLWNGTLYQAEYTEHYTVKTVDIELPTTTAFHRDGEGELAADTVLRYQIQPQSLKVIV